MTMEMFFEYVAEKGEDSNSIKDLIRKFCEEHEDFHFGSGATRIAIWHDSWDYVLKVDRRPANAYCALEAYHYARGREYRIDKILLPICKVCTIHEWTFYKQVKYECDWDDGYKKYRKELDNAQYHMRTTTFNRISNNLDYNLQNAWVARCTQLYGKKFMKSLQEWAKECKINDLHRGNIGFLQGKPVLLDYAGFRGTDYQVSQNILENF